MRAFLCLLLLCSNPAFGEGSPLRGEALRQTLPALGVSLELPLGWVVGRPPASESEPQMLLSAAHPTWPAIQIGRGPVQEGEMSVYELNFKRRLRSEGINLSDRRESTVSGQPAVVLTGTDGARLQVVTLVVLQHRLYYLVLLGIPPNEVRERRGAYDLMVESLQLVP